MLDVEAAIRLCDTHRKILERQFAAVHGLLNDPRQTSKAFFEAAAAALEQLYKVSLIISIETNTRMEREAELLVQQPAKLARLMSASSRLFVAHRDVAKLLKDVGEKLEPTTGEQSRL